MERDIRTSASYREALALVDDIRQPGRGQISDAAEANVSPDGQRVVFSGTLVERLEGAFPTRVCMTHLATGDTRVLTFGPNTDRSPKFAPDGRWIAFLSDREQSGDFQLYLLDLNNGSVRATARVDGWVEYFHWSPDGRLILLGVAGHGADLAGGQGAVPSKLLAENMPAWTPAIDTAEESHRWRHACMYDVADNRIRQASPVGANIWEAAWCGNDAFVAVVSPGPGKVFGTAPVCNESRRTPQVRKSSTYRRRRWDVSPLHPMENGWRSSKHSAAIADSWLETSSSSTPTRGRLVRSIRTDWMSATSNGARMGNCC